MNREIKFRGKRIDNGEWVYGDLLQPTEICDIYEIANCESIDGTRYEVIPETIGQFTGLYDKNGKEIYEGDILKGTFYGFPMPEYDYVFQIYWDEKEKGFMANYFEPSECEVIGNIYEDSELLGGE